MRILRCLRLFAPLGFVAVVAAQSTVPQHPLDGLTTAEYWTVHDVLQKSGHITDKDLVASLLLHEPDKAIVLAWKEGDPIPREADVILEEENKTFEARVDIANQKLESWTEVPGRSGAGYHQRVRRHGRGHQAGSPASSPH